MDELELLLGSGGGVSSLPQFPAFEQLKPGAGMLKGGSSAQSLAMMGFGQPIRPMLGPGLGLAQSAGLVDYSLQACMPLF
jgi:hypothetical protein